MLGKSDLIKVVDVLDKTEYFTNHGPSAREFESRIGQLFGCEAVAVSNLFVACAMLGVEFCILDMSLLTDLRVKAGFKLAGLRSGAASGDCKILRIFDFNVEARSMEVPEGAIVVVLNPFLNLPAIKILVNKCHALVISHERGEVVDTYTGASILSWDKQFLERMRNIRSSYGANEVLNVPVTSNGRFSEVQAVQGNLSIDRFLNNDQGAKG